MKHLQELKSISFKRVVTEISKVITYHLFVDNFMKTIVLLVDIFCFHEQVKNQ